MSPRYSASAPGLGRRRTVPGDDDDRQLRRLDAELPEQALHLRVGVGVEPLVGQAAPGEELADLEGLRREPRAHHTRRRRGAGEERGPTGHERGEDLVAEPGQGGDDPPERIGRHDQDLAGLADPRRHEDPLAGEEVQLAEEASAIVAGDEQLLAAGAEDDVHPAREDDVEVVGGVTLAVEVLPDVDRSMAAERLQRCELGVVERRKGGLVGHHRGGRVRGGHGFLRGGRAGLGLVGRAAAARMVARAPSRATSRGAVSRRVWESRRPPWSAASTVRARA